MDQDQIASRMLASQIGERYVGERRALAKYLCELDTVLERIDIGLDFTMLRERIRRALDSNDLRAIRNARAAWHLYPQEVRRTIQLAIFTKAYDKKA